jgi:hypothetical protein
VRASAPIAESPTATSARPSRPWLPRRLLTIGWFISVGCCVFAVGWLFLHPIAPRAVADYFNLPETPAIVDLGTPSYHTVIVHALVMLSLLSIFWIMLGLFIGPPAHRGVRSWLAITTVLAFWLGLAVSWRSLAAAGQQWRLDRQLDSFESLAKHLQDAWPKSDDHVAGLGAFNAYPIGHPRTLMVIAAEQADGAPPIAAVERSNAGALRFELGGDESGAWLEWHPPGSRPASFTGGLEDERRLNDAAPLADGWYLTHYLQAPSAAAPAPTSAK